MYVSIKYYTRELGLVKAKGLFSDRTTRVELGTLPVGMGVKMKRRNLSESCYTQLSLKLPDNSNLYH